MLRRERAVELFRRVKLAASGPTQALPQSCRARRCKQKDEEIPAGRGDWSSTVTRSHTREFEGQDDGIGE